MTNTSPSNKMKRNNATLQIKFKITNENKRLEILKQLKQRMMALNNHIKRYTTRQKQYQQNRMFENSPEKFYSELRVTRIEVEKVPSTDEVASFWRPIFEVEKKINKSSNWLNGYQKFDHC